MNIYIIQAVNYTLSFFMWMILGRVILALMLGGKENFMTGIFAKATEPIYLLVRKIMPFVKERAVPWVAILLIIILRLFLVIIFEPGTKHQMQGTSNSKERFAVLEAKRTNPQTGMESWPNS